MIASHNTVIAKFFCGFADLACPIDLAQSGMTMIVVTHEMGFARTVADEMVFMDEGRIVESAPPERFFADPESDRTKLFLSQILSH